MEGKRKVLCVCVEKGHISPHIPLKWWKIKLNVPFTLFLTSAQVQNKYSFSKPQNLIHSTFFSPFNPLGSPQEVNAVPTSHLPSPFFPDPLTTDEQKAEVQEDSILLETVFDWTA